MQSLLGKPCCGINIVQLENVIKIDTVILIIKKNTNIETLINWLSICFKKSMKITI